MRQAKRPRPTIQTAHEFHQQGIYSILPEHHLSDEERVKLSEDVYSDLNRLVKAQFPNTGNLEYAILKAHLIIEHAITQYIRCLSSVLVDLKNFSRFSFSQKLEFAYLMGFGVHDPIMLPTVERLNKIRNQVAHSFELDRSLVDEMIRINSEDYEAYVAKGDRDRIRCLRWICISIVGQTTGELIARLHYDKARSSD